MDRAILIAQKERNEFLLRVFQKQYQKSAAALERSCVRLGPPTAIGKDVNAER